MFWGRTNQIFLLIITHGVFSDGLFKAESTKQAHGCGESVTITYTLNEELQQISLQHGNITLLNKSVSTEKNPFKVNETIFIEVTNSKVTINFSSFKFSDRFKYKLTLWAASGYHTEKIAPDVAGVCEPEISENSTAKELVCEAESEQNGSIIWIDDHRKIYPASSDNVEELNVGFKLRTTLKLTEEIGDNPICCLFSYQENDGLKETESCFPNTSVLGTKDSQSSSKKSTISAVLVLLAVALVAVAFGYLLKRRNRVIIRARSFSGEPLIGQEVTADQNTTEPRLLQP